MSRLDVPLPPTASLDERLWQTVQDTRWDVTVVGAGLAGGVSAALLAERGWRVLLIDRAAWPRDKTCGGCLNARAMAALQDIAMAEALRGAQPLDHVVWHAGSQHLQLPTAGVAVDRATLDARIVAGAQQRGVTFLSAVAATLLPAVNAAPERQLHLRYGAQNTTIRSGLVLACDGIHGNLLAGEPWARWQVARHAWIGVSATASAWDEDLPPGAIHMCVGIGGYVGLVRLADRRVHIAAALDPAICRSRGGPARLAAEILRSCRHRHPPELHALQWHGTSQLTRARPTLGGQRVLAVGDACGYVEPFTGEGMAWAIQSARAVVDILPATPAAWSAALPQRWRRCQNATIRRRQFWCRVLRGVVHHPNLTAASLVLGRAWPPAGTFLAAHIGGESPQAASPGVTP